METRSSTLRTLLFAKYGSRFVMSPRAAKFGVVGMPALSTTSGGLPAAKDDASVSGLDVRNLTLMVGLSCINLLMFAVERSPGSNMTEIVVVPPLLVLAL